MWIVFEKRKPEYGPDEASSWAVAGATEHGAHATAEEACHAVAADVGHVGEFAAVRVEPVTVRVGSPPAPQPAV